MGSPTDSPSRRSVSRIVSTTGRLKSRHFLLVADHLMLEVDSQTFELSGALAEGRVEVHMLGGGEGVEYVIHGQSGVYQGDRQRIVLNGWTGTRENGINQPATGSRREVVVPTDGSFFHTSSDSAESDPGSGPAARAAA